MATVEGVRNAYYEFACEKAEKIAELRYYLTVDVDSDSEYDTEEYEGEAMEWDQLIWFQKCSMAKYAPKKLFSELHKFPKRMLENCYRNILK